MVDNSTLDSNKLDKLFKVQPMVDHLQAQFKKIPMTQSLCVDEQIISFKGVSGIKQYMPNKPHKWGYKFFVLADSKGMTYDFILHTGKIQPVDDPAIPDLKPSANSILHLAQAIGWSENNFFFEIEKSVVLKTCQTGKIYKKNWFWGLATPQNVF